MLKMYCIDRARVPESRVPFIVYNYDELPLFNINAMTLGSVQYILKTFRHCDLIPYILIF